jgi:hypothetical protein
MGAWVRSGEVGKVFLAHTLYMPHVTSTIALHAYGVKRPYPIHPPHPTDPALVPVARPACCGSPLRCGSRSLRCACLHAAPAPHPHHRTCYIAPASAIRAVCSVSLRVAADRGGNPVLSLVLVVTPASLIQRFFCPL